MKEFGWRHDTKMPSGDENIELPNDKSDKTLSEKLVMDKVILVKMGTRGRGGYS
jgi:hypothetical protein